MAISRRPFLVRWSPASMRRLIVASSSTSLLLVRQEWVIEEVGQDDLCDVAQPSRFPLDRSIASVRADGTASKVLGHEFHHLSPVSVLADGDAWSYLPPDFDAGSWADRNGEASFTVEVTGDV